MVEVISPGPLGVSLRMYSHALNIEKLKSSFGCGSLALKAGMHRGAKERRKQSMLL